MEKHQPEFNEHEDPASLTRVYNAIKKFNRNTTWVATGLLGSVILAALVIALQDRQSKPDDPPDKVSLSSVDLSPRADPVAITDFPPNKKSTVEIVSEQPPSLGRGLTPVINQFAAPSDVTSQSPGPGKDSGPAINGKIHHLKIHSSVQSRYVGAKARLIALWHQYFRRENSPGWTLSSNPNGWRKKKISYTAVTNH